MPSNNFSHFINPKKSEIIIPTILKSLQMYSFENEELSQVCGKYVYVVKDSISLGCVVIDKSQDIQIVPLLGPKLDQWLCLYQWWKPLQKKAAERLRLIKGSPD